MLLTHHVLTLPPKLRYGLLQIHVLWLGDFVPHLHLLILVAYVHHEHLDLCLLVHVRKERWKIVSSGCGFSTYACSWQPDWPDVCAHAMRKEAKGYTFTVTQLEVNET